MLKLIVRLLKKLQGLTNLGSVGAQQVTDSIGRRFAGAGLTSLLFAQALAE
jgi:hypothetical protein